ncbi:uncharacterized protein N7483_011321 [Penicillium malachiteum]|uniref:uncharacterized protein n=1 Tax=Penicillium malachiteum TaxID=1324776 RepID=UPI002547D1EA|nr:uncharacterized protein N7483_011321 [Penicillium malachiteum]KAJ5714140.1 hypothetical protein N7483_011321 [Penicillium malachiteum]
MYKPPAKAPVLQFIGEEQCCQFINQELDKYEGIREDLLRKCCKSYDPQQSMVVIEIPSCIHAVACAAFGYITDTWLRQSETLILSTVSASVCGKMRDNCEGRMIRPDGSLKLPREELPCGKSWKWPILVVEIKLSEPISHLMEDIIFWVDESDGDVKVMITVSISRGYKIKIQRWNLHRRPNRADPIPFPTGKIEITRSPNKKSPHKITENLTISFEDLYLRPKKPKSTECDLTFARESLEQMAEQIWITQEQA